MTLRWISIWLARFPTNRPSCLYVEIGPFRSNCTRFLLNQSELQRTMPNSVSLPSLTRRRFTQLSGMAVGSLALSGASRAAAAPDVTLEIAPYTLEASPKHHIRTAAYNGQIPGPLFRMRECEPQSVEIRNLTKDSEIVHWHGLYLPSDIDGAMEERRVGKECR